MRVLVTYGTKMGGTAGIAEILGDALSDAGFHLDVRPTADVADVGAYDAVVVGGAVYAGRWHRDARRFVKRNTRVLPGQAGLAVQQRSAGRLRQLRGDPPSRAGAPAARAGRRRRARHLRRPAPPRRQGLPGQRDGEDPRRGLARPGTYPGMGGQAGVGAAP
jgi:menaquinone-dependent protoporphyrinogen oxidase